MVELKVVSGDREQYDNAASQELPTFNLRYIWMLGKDDDNSFKDYISEDDYTEEMQREFYHLGDENVQKEEQKRRGMHR